MRHEITEENIVLAAADTEALALMLGERSRGVRDADPSISNLIETLQIADIVASGPELDGRVRMNSSISLVESGFASRELVLTWPNDAAPEQGRISVLSPIGTALLGRRAGDDVTVKLPNGSYRVLTVTAVRAPQDETEPIASP